MKISAFNITKEIPEKLIKINKVLAPFYEKGIQSSNELYFKVKDSKNIETFLNDIYNLSCEYIDEAVQMAIEHLIKLDIWDYNVDRFNEEYQENYYDIDALYDEFFGEKYQDIMDEEQNIKLARSIERAGRASWSGGGFGLSGAIKGAVQAELLNLATDAIHSVNDSAEDAADRADINKLKKQLLNDNKNLELYTGHLRILIQYVGWALYDFLIKNEKLEKYEFDFETSYARYNNIIESNLSNEDKAYKIIDCILMYPYYFDFFKTLYELEPSKEVYDVAVHFGFYDRIKYIFLSEFWEDCKPMSQMPGGSPKLINKKFKAFVELMKKYNFMKVDGNWNEEFVQDYKLFDVLKEHKITYNILEKERRTFNKVEYSTVKEAQVKYEEYVENKKLERERAETIETIKNFLGTAIPLAIIAVVIYFIYYIFSESGILSALLDLFSSVGN